MTVLGRWQVIETLGYNLIGPGAYILFAEEGGEFAFDYLTGSIHGACHGDDVEFDWDGNDESQTASPRTRLGRTPDRWLSRR